MPQFTLKECDNKKIYRFGKLMTEDIDFDDSNASAATEDITFINATYENIKKYDCVKLKAINPGHDFTALIMLKNNNLVGYGYLDDGFKHNVVILPEYKNAGYGTLLMDKLYDMMRTSMNNIELDQTRKSDVVQGRPFNDNEITFYKNPVNGTTNAIVEYKSKNTRLRAAMLVLKDDMVLLSEEEFQPGVFSIPGGGLEENESVIQAATREVNEEVHLKVKNVIEAGFDYCDCYDDVTNWVKENIPEEQWWYNYYTCLTIGEYAGVYTDKVDPVDEDPYMRQSAKFYPINEVMNLPSFKPAWKMALRKLGYGKPEMIQYLTEETRSTQISKSRNAGPYKDQTHGKNRFERKRYSKIATTVKQYNTIDMNEFFKRDTLIVDIPVTGESNNYTVTVKFEGVLAEMAKNIKSNHNKLEFRTVIQSLTKVFNSGDVYTKCSCDDFKFRFKHWSIIDNVSVDDTSNDPGPGKGIANPNNDKGRGCKHILLVLANLDWIMKVASCIKNYIFYVEEHNTKIFDKVIFPKLYGMTTDEAIEKEIIPEDVKLDSEKHLIELINDWAKNRGKYMKGSNINPVQADRLEKEQKAAKAKESEGK